MSQFSVPLSQASGVYELETDSETETALERSCGNALLRQRALAGTRSCGNCSETETREAWPRALAATRSGGKHGLLSNLSTPPCGKRALSCRSPGGSLTVPSRLAPLVDRSLEPVSRFDVSLQSSQPSPVGMNNREGGQDTVNQVNASLEPQLVQRGNRFLTRWEAHLEDYPDLEFGGPGLNSADVPLKRRRFLGELMCPKKMRSEEEDVSAGVSAN